MYIYGGHKFGTTCCLQLHYCHRQMALKDSSACDHFIRSLSTHALHHSKQMVLFFNEEHQLFVTLGLLIQVICTYLYHLQWDFNVLRISALQCEKVEIP